MESNNPNNKEIVNDKSMSNSNNSNTIEILNINNPNDMEISVETSCTIRK